MPRIKDGRPKTAALRKMWGGFPEQVHDLLASDPALLAMVAEELLKGHFPQSLHLDIRDAVGIPEFQVYEAARFASRDVAREGSDMAGKGWRDQTRRDPKFRHRVLRAYERRCAVCDFDVRVEDQLLGLEAAHIKWHAAGGPDEVPNGLALCSLHHKALDVGALGLRMDARRVRVMISAEVNGMSPAVRQLREYTGEPLRRPQDESLAPDPMFLNWHRREVFRSPALR